MSKELQTYLSYNLIWNCCWFCTYDDDFV